MGLLSAHLLQVFNIFLFFNLALAYQVKIWSRQISSYDSSWQKSPWSFLFFIFYGIGSYNLLGRSCYSKCLGYSKANSDHITLI